MISAKPQDITDIQKLIPIYYQIPFGNWNKKYNTIWTYSKILR